MNNALSQLQNGADIRGVATEGIIGEPVTLSESVVSKIGVGFAAWLHQKQAKEQSQTLRIAIGTDTRLSGPTLAEALQKALIRIGCDVMHCGVASTPAMMNSTIYKELMADGAIMLTGSHMTFNRNGMKFFTQGRDINADELTEIIKLAEKEALPPKSNGNFHIVNIMSLYARKLREKIIAELQDLNEDDPTHPLKGLKIIVDAGNGAGNFFVSRVLKPLGADTTGSQFLSADGRFPNHSPNPEDYEAVKSASNAVIHNDADLGIIFDSDVDRAAIIDRGGKVINRNEFVALAATLVQEEHPHTDIVTDSITSTGLTTYVQETLGAHQCRYQRGYRNVIAEAIRKNNSGTECWLAAETSGHAAFKENNFCDDGAYFAVKVIIRLAKLKREGKTISSLIERLPVPLESREYRIRICSPDFARTAEETIRGLRQYVAQISDWEEVNQNHEGLRVMCKQENQKGWFLCRLSLHSPDLPINVEADTEGGVKNIVNQLKLYFRNTRDIDSSSLYK